MKFEYYAALLSSIAIIIVGSSYYFSSPPEPLKREPPRTFEEAVQQEKDRRTAIEWGDDATLEGLKWKDKRNILHPDVKLFEGGTALHLIAEEGYPRCIQFLLDYGYNTTIKNDKGLTPADVARQNGHENIARMIETYVPNPDGDGEQNTKPSIIGSIIRFIKNKSKNES